MEKDEWTSEGEVEKHGVKKRKKRHKGRSRPKERGGGRMMLDRVTQVILPPGSDDNPNAPGI